MMKEVPGIDLVRRLTSGSREELVEAAKELARRKDRSLLAEITNILLCGDSPPVREMAVWLLGELSPGTDLSIDALHAIVNDPRSTDSLRGQAIESLGNQVSHLKGGDVYERAADAFIPLLQHSSVDIVYNAVFALGTIRCRRARPLLARIAAEDHRVYKGLETMSENARLSIECIDYEPQGR